MKKSHQVTAVALHLPQLMGMLDQFFNEAVGRGQHEIILVVGAGDQQQYVSNTERARGVEALQSLLARWKVGLPDTLPGESTPGDTAGFELLLNEFERAVTAPPSDQPLILTRENARANLVQHVGALVAKLQRSAS